MSQQTDLTGLNEKKDSGPTPNSPAQDVQSTCSGICIKQEYFEDQLLMTRTINTESESFFQDQLPVTVKNESESAPNEHNIMQSIKVEVKEEHYHDQDCVVKCELDFDEGEQINRKIKVKIEDDSSGQSVQLGECVKKEEDDGGEYVMDCDCEDCEVCRVKMEMKEELDEIGFETELGGNSGLAIQSGTRVKKEEEDGEVERPNKIQRMDRVVGNVPVGSPSSNVMSINVEYVDDQVASTSSTNPITIEDHTQPSQPFTTPLPTPIVTPPSASSSSTQHVNEDGVQSFERQESQDTSAAGGQQVQQVLTTDNFVKRIEPADELGNRFECDYQQCGRRLKRRGNLIRHIRSHTGEKPFKCSVEGCDRAFVQKSDLKSHLNVHSGDRPFVCTYPRCEARFATKSNLTAHLRTHTGERPYQCDLCDAAFTRHSDLVAHLRTHTGARPFVCTWPECGQAFIQSSHLTTHSRVHSNERQFECDVTGCTKVYKHKHALLRHQMTKHN